MGCVPEKGVKKQGDSILMNMSSVEIKKIMKERQIKYKKLFMNKFQQVNH